VARITQVAAEMGLSGVSVMVCSLDYPHHCGGLQTAPPPPGAIRRPIPRMRSEIGWNLC
jgi:hypothetical protein